jgi:putative regulator of septum formation
MSRLVGNIGVRLAVVGLFVVGGFLFRDRLSGAAEDLRVGDCFEEPAGQQVIEDVQHQPCTENHDAEVVFVGNYPAAKAAATPAGDEYETYVATNCLPAFATYTGVDVMSQEVLGIGYYTPTNEGWRAGDREIMCYAARMDGASMKASVRTAH